MDPRVLELPEEIRSLCLLMVEGLSVVGRDVFFDELELARREIRERIGKKVD